MTDAIQGHNVRNGSKKSSNSMVTLCKLYGNSMQTLHKPY